MARSRHLRSPFKGDRRLECFWAFCRKGMSGDASGRGIAGCRGAMRRFAGSRRGAQLENHVSHRCRCVLILDVYCKKTRKIPSEVIERCEKRLKQYDEVVKAAKKQTGK
jgi:hypothetical protein